MADRAYRCTDSTLKFYEGKLNPFLVWLEEQGVTRIGDVKVTHVRKYLAAVERRGVSVQYQNNIGRAIRAFLIFCHEDGYLPERIQFKLPKVEKKVLRAVSEADLLLTLRRASLQRDRTLVRFLYDTGVRASEALAMEVGDVDLRGGTALVREGKGRKQRVVMLGTRTRRELLNYFGQRKRPGAGEPLFTNERTGDRLTLSGLTQIFRRLREVTGVKDLTAHALRRSYAIGMLRGGANIHVLARLMGHEDIEVLRRYLDITEQDLKDAHRKAGPGDRLK